MEAVNWLEYEKRLRSEDRSERQKALKELISMGIRNLNEKQLEEYAKKKVNLLHTFVVYAHLHDPAIGKPVAWAIASTLQSCWADVEHILKNPSLIINELGEKGKIFNEDKEARTWFFTQMQNIYYYLYILTWDVRCSRCGQRISYADQGFVIKHEKGKVKFMHVKCAVEELNTIKEYRDQVEKLAMQMQKNQSARQNANRS